MNNSDLVCSMLVMLLATTAACATADAATSGGDTTMMSDRTGNAEGWNGTVAETMDSGGYTYVLLDTGSEKIWVAATQTLVKVGQRVSVPPGMAMRNFASKTLNRSFDQIYFVGGIYPEGVVQTAGGSAQGTGSAGMTASADTPVERVPKAEGGYTVAEILAADATLDGQPLKVRGRVVKFTPNIMGVNWMHIQDGSGGDLTVTTHGSLAKGDLVLVEGLLSRNRDFGAGYSYPVMIEKAQVTKE